VKILVAAAAALSLILAAALATAALNGSEPKRGAGQATACGNAGWAATATGRPATLSSARRSSFYVWREAPGWHLAVRGASRSSPLTGRVQADAALRVLSATSAARSGLRARPRALTVRVASGEPARIDFKSPCATRLSFRLGSDSPVLLGATGRAPASTFRLDRPAVTGVAGRILVGPTCPAVGPSGCPNAKPKPTQGTVRIETAPGRKGGQGQVVARVKSDANGKFSADVGPGRYLLVVEKSGGYPTPKPSVAGVEAGVVTQVDLYLETGIL
jgi:hypothetical protein